jgi:hypothetical protein
MITAQTFLAPGKHYPNATVLLKVSFKDEDGVLTNPTTVTLTLITPYGDETDYVYDTDSEVTRPSTGKYRAEVVPDMSGRWRYAWTTTGTNLVTAIEGDFLVQESPLSSDVCGYDYSAF